MSSLISELKPILARDTWLIALDRDGTLVPIVDDPAEAVIQDGLRKTLHALAQEPGVHVALVSARGVLFRNGASDAEPRRKCLRYYCFGVDASSAATRPMPATTLAVRA